MIDEKTANVNGKPPGWFRVPNAALEHIADVGPLAFCVYCVLVRHTDERGECWPSIPRIASLCGCTDRAVQMALRTLAAAGLVRITRRDDAKGQTSNLYTIPPVNPVNVASPPGERGFTGGVNVASPPPVNPASPRRKTHSEEDQFKKTQGRESAAVAAAPAGLIEFLLCWNTNCPEGKQTRTDPPTKAVLTGWKKLAKEPELREAFADLDAMGAAIRGAEWARSKPWFTVEALFAKDSSRLIWKATKLLRGDYSGGNSNGRKALPVRGCKYDPSAPIAISLD